jgi:predicted lipoprotein with Yx(FWY)xxD motif
MGTLAASMLVACGGSDDPAAAPILVEGGILVAASNHFTLYTFDKDVVGSGKSTCNDACATIWPVLSATVNDQASAPYTIITRDDGSLQWAVNGKPLYFFHKDSKAGDRTGDGVNGVWHVVKP